MVLKRLFGRTPVRPPQVWRAPVGQRLYAIGDIHGRRDLLDELLAMIDADDAARGPSKETRLIFLGDLVDRGPDSRTVVERVMALTEASESVICLKGNHEELLIRSWEGDRKTAAVFHRNGGRETILSYGVDPETYDAGDLGDVVELIGASVPPRHIAFLDGLSDWVQAGDYLFVHAGIKPGVDLEEQSASDMRWIRKDFTDWRGDHGLMVVHGHTITDGVDAQDNRIGIDTGAYATGRLTAIGLEDDQRWFISTGAPDVATDPA
jgi:serine/threonine protein phosphatase 1